MKMRCRPHPGGNAVKMCPAAKRMRRALSVQIFADGATAAEAARRSGYARYVSVVNNARASRLEVKG